MESFQLAVNSQSYTSLYKPVRIPKLFSFKNHCKLHLGAGYEVALLGIFPISTTTTNIRTGPVVVSTNIAELSQFGGTYYNLLRLTNKYPTAEFNQLHYVSCVPEDFTYLQVLITPILPDVSLENSPDIIVNLHFRRKQSGLRQISTLNNTVMYDHHDTRS